LGVTSTETNVASAPNDYLGHFAEAISFAPSASAPAGVANAALYTETRTTATNQVIWGLNPLIQIQNTITAGAATGVEIDVNTGPGGNAPDPPSSGLVGQIIGLTITGLQPPGHAASAAVLIGGNWKHGL